MRINSLNEIDHSDLYKIFVSNRKGEYSFKLNEFYGLEQAIKFIDIIIPDLQKFYSEFTSSYSNANTFWFDNINKLTKYYDSNKSRKDPLMEKFNQFVSNLNGINNSEDFPELHLVVQELISPLEKCCKENEDNERFPELSPLIRDCKTAYLSIVKLKKFYSDQANNRRIKYEEIRSQLKDSLYNLLEIKRINKLFLLFS